MKLNFTFIIVTHERHDYLKTMLNFYENNNHINFDILICDSSFKAYNISVHKDIFQYFHYPNLPYIEKISKILERVKTKYSLIGTDDDYFIIENFEKMIEILESDFRINSIDGRIVTFDKEFETTPEGILTRKSLIYDNPIEALENNLKNFFQIYYSIVKTQILIDVFLTMKKFTITNIYLYEHILGAISLIRGYHIHCNLFFCARDTMAPPSLAEHRGDINRIEKQYEQNTIQYKKFILIIANELAANLPKQDKQYCKAKAATIVKENLIEKFLYNQDKFDNVRKSNFIEKKIKEFLSLILPQHLSTKVYELHWQWRINNSRKKTINKLGYPYYDPAAKKQWQIIKKHLMENECKS